MGNLIDVPKLKLHLGIAETNCSQDDYLTQLADHVWETVRGWTNRYLDSNTYTEYYDGNGRQRVQLRNRPLTALTSVQMDQIGFYGQGPGGFDPATTTLTLGTDFYADNFVQDERNPSELVMITNPWAFGVLAIGEPVTAPRSIWYVGNGNIKVTYTAGYSILPNDLELACFQLCAMLKNSRPIGDFKGQVTMGKSAYTLLAKGQGPQIGRIQSILGRYTECAI